MIDDDATFRRLRRLARDSGFDVRRHDGGYQLTQGNRVIAGDHHALPDLKDVARELQRIHVLGR
ncbi:hypothetical protein [Mesorhizobium sp. M0496]|uniref:hypothetical protein n=1 Tax=Mesorhizobium sp. M0496 TaxID=2956952 RepID=UPI00333E08AE